MGRDIVHVVRVNRRYKRPILITVILPWPLPIPFTDGAKSLEQTTKLDGRRRLRSQDPYVEFLIAKWLESRIEGFKVKATSEIGNEVTSWGRPSALQIVLTLE